MNEPLLPTSRRPLLGTLFRRPKVPADPSPQRLAEILKEAGVHRSAAKRLDQLEAAEAQHKEDRRAKTCLLLGTAGLVLSLTPALPAVHGACFGNEPGWECALRATALAGGFLALSGSIITGIALYHHKVRLDVQEQRLSATLERAQHSKSGAVAISDLYSRVRSMTHDERHEFTQHLHGLAKEPKHPLVNAAANIMVA